MKAPPPRGQWTVPLAASNGQPSPIAHLIAFNIPSGGAWSIDSIPTEAEDESIPWPETIACSVPLRQVEYLMGRRAAARALSQFGMSSARIGTGAQREPLWPEGIVGSITHIPGLAAAVAGPVALYASLGLDLERVARGASQLALRDVALHPNEIALLATHAKHGGRDGDHFELPSDSAVQFDLDALVTLAFSAKEALYKAAFPLVRRILGFDEARVCAVDIPAKCLSLEITASSGSLLAAGSRWSIAFDLIEPSVWLTSLTIAR